MSRYLGSFLEINYIHAGKNLSASSHFQPNLTKTVQVRPPSTSTSTCVPSAFVSLLLQVYWIGTPKTMNLMAISVPNYRPDTLHLSFPGNFLIPFSPNERRSNSGSNLSVKSGFCSVPNGASLFRITSRNRSGLGCVCVKCDGSLGGPDDGLYMRRCVELARRAIGCTSPNPMVGCVVVNNGKIVGEGFHPKAGQPHAEVFALRDAGNLAENGTAYVSLEPCNHYGRTPPCTDALIKAKVKRVVVGLVDPNPIVASKGVDKLRNAGIDVTVGIEEELCKRLNEAYIHQMLTGMPFVTLRYSLSVDGQILNELGRGVMDSGGYYSKLLQEHDAVIHPYESTDTTDLCPASKEPGAKQPFQIVITRNSISPVIISKPTSDAAPRVVVVTDKYATPDTQAANKESEMVVLDKVNLVAILEYCKKQGLCSVLLDFRGNIDSLEDILKEAFEQNLLQKLVVEVLPIWSGSRERKWPLALKNPSQANVLKNLTSTTSGSSILLEGYF